ncbi:MAG: thiamine-phosphate kinase [Candidatus Solibacter sp.]|nr:thiamine-phosphate kinase [Candidatus Solibacter sp.]
MTISDIGEKRLIADIVRPLFNPDLDFRSVGDDCAMIDLGSDRLLLVSTDRVPADLIAFRKGILDYSGLGGYLARLNISDIAACGGSPLGLLLNLALPPSTELEAFKELCSGVALVSQRYQCPVLGGDLSSSVELSLSATSVGIVDRRCVLTRQGALPGDTVFVSRPVGLTPAALRYLTLPETLRPRLEENEVKILKGQFTNMEPMVSLGRRLAESLLCTSCMDNTDGIAQSLSELAASSNCAFVIDKARIRVSSVVERLADSIHVDAVDLALGPGADFSLVGTLSGKWTPDRVREELNASVEIIGTVEEGAGVYIDFDGRRSPLPPRGWNYFSPNLDGALESD